MPDASTTTVIANGGTATVASDVSCNMLQIGTAAGSGTVRITGGSMTMEKGMAYVGHTGKGDLIQTDGTLTVQAGWGLDLGAGAGSVGTYTLIGGSVSGQCELLGADGEAHFIQWGGTNTAEGWFQMAANAGSYATYELKGGRVTTANQSIGARGRASFIQSGGINDLSAGGVYLADSPGSVGSYELSGGELITRAETIGSNGQAVFTQSGGTNTATIGVTIGYSSSGTYNLNGGRLITGRINGGFGTPVFNFGGGTLQASATFSSSLPMTLTGNGGNANVDTTNGDVTLSGILSGSGGLNKLGTGTLTLSATDTYKGETAIACGTLSIAKPFLSDLADVRISSEAKLNLNFSGSDTIHSLALDGFWMAAGTWGSSASGAAHIDNVHFSGTGMLNVLSVPEPSTLTLLSMSGIGLIACGWRRRTACLMVLAMFLIVGSSDLAQADVFNMGGTRNTEGTWNGLASLEMVPVGDPGNVSDSIGLGSVANSYFIGKYEVTNAQWLSFLSAKAAIGDPHGLYNSGLGYSSGIVRSGSGTTADPYLYNFKDPDWTNRPVCNVSFWDAARFCNWLHSGQGNSDTETGAYTNIGDQAKFARQPDATYFIPTKNEWYKAAYYDPQKPGGPGYWDYPTRSDVAPINTLVTPDPGNHANFKVVVGTGNGSYTIG